MAKENLKEKKRSFLKQLLKNFEEGYNKVIGSTIRGSLKAWKNLPATWRGLSK